LEWRVAQLGQEPVRKLITGLGFNLPPSASRDEATPPSTAVVRGLISGSPRRVHQMASVVLASLTDQGHKPVRPPTLVSAFDYTSRDAANAAQSPEAAIKPNSIIKRDSVPLLKALLSAPLCYRANGTAHGTLKALAHWCADGRADMRLHFAKTGTSVTVDPNATVDTWITGGLQFANGAAYSYVVLVGTGHDSWARSVHAAQAAVPLAEVLLSDLKDHAKRHPGPQPAPVASAVGAVPTVVSSAAEPVKLSPGAAPQAPDTSWRDEVLRTR
jgi:penicillin-binding protein 1A